MASKSHSLSGNCADLPIAPPNSKTNAGTNNPCADISTAQAVSPISSLNPKVPAYMNSSNIPESIITSPTLVMMKAFIPACVGEKYSIIPNAVRPSCPTWSFFLSRYQKLIKAYDARPTPSHPKKTCNRLSDSMMSCMEPMKNIIQNQNLVMSLSPFM